MKPCGQLLVALLLGAGSLAASNYKEENLMATTKHSSVPPQNEELKPLSSEAKSFQGGEIYEHYKGKQYKVLSVGRNSETLEEIIVYQALYGNHDVWVRPLKMFSENVVINGLSQPRFKRVRLELHGK